MAPHKHTSGKTTKERSEEKNMGRPIGQTRRETSKETRQQRQTKCRSERQASVREATRQGGSGKENRQRWSKMPISHPVIEK